MLWEGDTRETKLDILLLFSDFAQKPVLLGAVAELLLQTQIILLGVSRRALQGPALGCLAWQNFLFKSRLCSELILIIFTSDLGNGVESIPFKHADGK